MEEDGTELCEETFLKVLQGVPNDVSIMTEAHRGAVLRWCRSSVHQYVCKRGGWTVDLR
jgi:hypothetical protein